MNGEDALDFLEERVGHKIDLLSRMIDEADVEMAHMRPDLIGRRRAYRAMLDLIDEARDLL